MSGNYEIFFLPLIALDAFSCLGYKNGYSKNQPRLSGKAYAGQFFPIMGSWYWVSAYFVRSQTFTKVFSNLVSTLVSLNILPNHVLSGDYKFP